MSDSRLTILTIYREKGRLRALCKCSCGNHHVAGKTDVLSGRTKSCGCLRSESSRRTCEDHTTHGCSRNNTTNDGRPSRAYNIWASMKKRCNNQKSTMYKYYGFRGIKVCDDWNNSFESFLNDMGEPEPGMSLDRIDNDRGYSKENCRWATKTTQNRNKTSNTVFVFQEKTRTLAEISEITGVHRSTIYRRIKAGADIETAALNVDNRTKEK